MDPRSLRAKLAAVCLAGAGLLLAGQASAQTPQLLRGPERLMSEADCTALARRVAFLRDPAYPQQLRKTLASLERLKAQAIEGKWEADRRLWQEMHDRANDYVDDLSKIAVKGLQEQSYRNMMRRLHARGTLPASPNLVALKRVEDRLREFYFNLDKAMRLKNSSQDAYRRALGDAASSHREALAAQEYATQVLASDETLKDLADFLADGLPPQLEWGYKLSYLVFVSALPNAWERYVSAPREIENLQASIDQVRHALQRVELDRGMSERQHARNCAEPPRQAESSPGAASTASGPGFGAALGVTALVGGGVALAALAASSLGSGGGDDGPGSSSGGNNACAGNTRAQCCTATSPGSTPVACAVRSECGCPSGTADTGATSCGPGQAFGSCRMCRC